MKELQIFPLGGIWYVNHLVDGELDAEITELFNGESFLPSPFMTVIRLQQVVSLLVKLNPGKKVSIAVAAIPFCHGLTCDRCGRDFNVPASDKLEYFADPTKPVHCGRCLYTSILERNASVVTATDKLNALNRRDARFPWVDEKP